MKRNKLKQQNPFVTEIMRGFKETGDRMDWTAKAIREIPRQAVDKLTEEYQQHFAWNTPANNQNTQGEWIINEYSKRTGNGPKVYTPDREEHLRDLAKAWWMAQ